jgi:hypothetical protein
MNRVFALALVGAVLAGLVVSAPVERQPPKKKFPNQQSEDAAKWLADAGDRFAFSLNGCGETVLFVRDKKAIPSGVKKAFVITGAQAASIVQGIVNSGLWYRRDTAPGGPLPVARYMNIGVVGPQDVTGGFWGLGGCADDVSDMFVIQHLLKTFNGEPRQAILDWLAVKPAVKK